MMRDMPMNRSLRRPPSARAIQLSGLVLACIAIVHTALAADPLDPKAIPEPLRPWTEWALDGADDARCAGFFARPDVASCSWPTRLDLSLDDHGGRFSQKWHGDARRWVLLPGDEERWPLDAKLDGVRAVLISRSGVPSLQAGAGDHVVSGAFEWDSLPDSLRIPPETGLLALRIRGSPVDWPNRDARGTVWLQTQAAPGDGDDALEIVVHRKLVDGVPLMLTTRVELHVAGKNREVLLGKALPLGFIPMSLEARLPVRVEPDGRMRAQIEPGITVLTLTARSEGDLRQLARPDPQGPWSDADEVWVFEAKSDFRVVTVEGSPSVDPQQTTLPAEWKRLPAYLIKAGAVLTLAEKRRGNADPPPDSLSLSRQLWLDFDGSGYSVRDRITGTLSRDSRLTMPPPTRLGRVSVDGQDQFITRLGDDLSAGVEFGRGQVALVADSRMPGGSDVSAVGWAHDFHQATGSLHLPPGWRLVHASGVDDVPGTWIRHWTLLELFLGLIASIGVWRLYGARWGVVALLTFVLTLPEVDAPHWTWLAPLATEAIFRVLPAGKTKAFFIGMRGAAFLLVALIAIPFMVQHVREGLYPGLASEGVRYEQDGRELDDEAKGASREGRGDVGASAPSLDQTIVDGLRAKEAPAPPSSSAELKPLPAKPAAPLVTSALVDRRPAYEPAAVVQTGPGLPHWQGSTLDLHWIGPVAATQRVRFFLLSPGANLVLALLRAALLVAILLRLIPWAGALRPWGWLLGLAIALAPGRAQADVPSPDLLKELAERLARPPSCAPVCASTGRLLLDVRDRQLLARIEVDASAAAAVPLPGKSSEWSPTQVTIDGHPARALARTGDGLLWIELGAGAHQIAIDGPMPDRSSVSLALPMKPHHVEVSASGWTVSGVHEDGLADDALRLDRKRASAAHITETGEIGTLPPFVRVQRTLHVGIDWQIDTRVERVSPAGSSVAFEVPLLSGESVTTAGVRVTGGKALVDLGSESKAVVWHSVLEQKSPFRLNAGPSPTWVEVWRLEIGPMWHASFAGIPSIQPQPRADSTSTGAAKAIPEWHPWPGESLTVDLVRPAGVPGQTLTVDESATEVHPGLRATDVALTLRLRSSLGSEHTVRLPPGAQLESLTIDDTMQPIRQQGEDVTVPVVPGPQKIALSWREPRGLGGLFWSPRIDLGLPSVNATTIVHVPTARWLLFVGGPRVGPAVLFWSLLLILIPVSLVLGVNRTTPLRWWHWLLLSVGLSQVNIVAGAVFVGWLLALGWRGRAAGASTLDPRVYNVRQLALVVWTFVALAILVGSLVQGLLGAPDMQVDGNGSTSTELRWFTDRADGVLPRGWMFSVPLFAYRAAMLAWALWIALALLDWLRWGWGELSTGGLWLRRHLVTAPDAAALATQPLDPTGSGAGPTP